MAFIPVPNAAQVVVQQSLFGEDVNNVMHFARSGGWPLASLGALATLVATTWTAEVMPVLSSELTLVGVSARDLSVADGQQALQPVSPAVEGGIDQQSLPGNVAFVVTHRTAFIGRSRRGRNYIGGLPEGAVTQNSLLTTTGDALAAAFNTLRATCAAQGFFFCIVSRYANNLPRVEGITTAVDVSEVRDYRVDSQRGRLRGTGLG